MNSNVKKVAVIGAGPAGLTAAYELCKSGACSVTVFEATNSVGGLSRSFLFAGHTVDLGPHRFFSGDKRINQLWHEIISGQHVTVRRETRIFYAGRLFHYPLQVLNVLKTLGPIEALRCVGSYAVAQLGGFLSRKNNSLHPFENFESWGVARFGRRLFDIFFRSYTEKLWGVPCRELSADFGRQRIQNFSLLKAGFAAIGLQKNRPRTLVEQFFYPAAGTGYFLAASS